jgi:drug/metabolite transporter (DMT)-like permease
MNLKKDHAQFALGAFYMSLSASFLSLSFLFIKLGIQNVPYFLFAFLRFLIPLLLLLILLLCTGKLGQSFRLSIPFSLHLARSFCVLAAQYSLLFYLSKNTLLNATVLLNTGPLIIPILERLFLKHPIGKSTWIGLLVSALGVGLMLQPSKDFLNIYIFVGLFAALMQASSQVLYGVNSEKDEVTSSLFYLFFISSLFSFFILCIDVFLVHPSKLFYTETNINLWALLGVGLATIGNQFFRGYSYKKGRPSRLATFFYLSVIVSGFLDWAIFHQLPNTLSFIGAFFVVLGGLIKIYLRYLILKKRELWKK